MDVDLKIKEKAIELSDAEIDKRKAEAEFSRGQTEIAIQEARAKKIQNDVDEHGIAYKKGVRSFTFVIGIIISGISAAYLLNTLILGGNINFAAMVIFIIGIVLMMAESVRDFLVPIVEKLLGK